MSIERLPPVRAWVANDAGTVTVVGALTLAVLEPHEIPLEDYYVPP